MTHTARPLPSLACQAEFFSFSSFNQVYSLQEKREPSGRLPPTYLPIARREQRVTRGLRLLEKEEGKTSAAAAKKALALPTGKNAAGQGGPCCKAQAVGAVQWCVLHLDAVALKEVVSGASEKPLPIELAHPTAPKARLAR